MRIGNILSPLLKLMKFQLIKNTELINEETKKLIIQNYHEFQKLTIKISISDEKLITRNTFFVSFDYYKWIFSIVVWFNGMGFEKLITLTMITLTSFYCINNINNLSIF
jgi:hypothetical protein